MVASAYSSNNEITVVVDVDKPTYRYPLSSSRCPSRISSLNCIFVFTISDDAEEDVSYKTLRVVNVFKDESLQFPLNKAGDNWQENEIFFDTREPNGIQYCDDDELDDEDYDDEYDDDWFVSEDKGFHPNRQSGARGNNAVQQNGQQQAKYQDLQKVQPLKLGYH